MKTVGIILAGGESRRFGSPKAFAKLGNRYFYEVVKEALASHCDEVVVVTRQELVARFPVGVNVIMDGVKYAGRGPLAGILSGMESVEADRYVVLPCDMPFVDGEVIGELLARHEQAVTAVVVEGRHHPLVSVWDADVMQVLREALDSDQLRVMAVLSTSGVTWIEGYVLTENEKQVFANVNTPEVLERG
ncbi:molybdenum cofactor guanylyltransferase [Sporosarcina sp. FSL K6-1522]|uniref:molybdenum cofactor guanylyltransferase n=1 Tax=Sporosarcina sp. FSL K6-1522 TaxID=2921554 RepID=UPI00315B0714